MGQCLGGRARRRVGVIQQCPAGETENRRLQNELELERIRNQSLETEITRLQNELINERIAKQNLETETNRLWNELEEERFSRQSLETEISRLRNELERVESEWVINSSDIHMSDSRLGEGCLLYTSPSPRDA